MATTANQNLLLGKLRRAVSSSLTGYTTEFSMSNANGHQETGLSYFSISSCGSALGGYTYLWEQTTEGYYLDVANPGSLWKTKIGANNDHFTWGKSVADSILGAPTLAGYSASFAEAAISNANTGT